MYEEMGELGQFEAKISLLKGLPYGIQHVLTMFVANLAPIMMICAEGHLFRIYFTSSARSSL